MPISDNLLRAAALASILVAGSCALASNDSHSIGEDGAVNHPILVEPNFRELKVQYAGPTGMTVGDAAAFDDFLSDYRAHGNGSLGISVPGGPPAHAAITFFAERAAASGIPRDKILVSTHDVADGDFRVDVSYIAYSASTKTCGDWSENLAYTSDNLTPKNFGCAVQQNIAAQLADPRDLIRPRSSDPADGNRKTVIITNYEAGKPTAAEKRTTDMSSEQSAPGSGIGK